MTAISMIGRILRVVLALGVVLSGGATPAAAQAEPTIAADPASVEAAGEQTFVVTGAGWGTPAVFVLSCAIPESGRADEIDPDSCDVADAVGRGPVDIVDGGFEVEVTFDVPAEGIAIAAGGNTNPDDPTEGEEQAAGVLVTIGGGATTAPDRATTEPTDVSGADAGAPDAELAATGAATGLLALIGFVVLAAGLVIVIGTTRRPTRSG